MVIAKTHKGFIRKVETFGKNRRLITPTGWTEDTSPYSEGFVEEGRKVKIIFTKEGKGNKSFWVYKWKLL